MVETLVIIFKQLYNQTPWLATQSLLHKMLTWVA